MRLGFLGRAGPPDDRLCLRKIRSWEKSILFSPKHALSEWLNYWSWESTIVYWLYWLANHVAVTIRYASVSL